MVATQFPPYGRLEVGEPDANSEYFSALRVNRRPIFLDSFYLLPHFPLEEFLTGQKYIIFGQKGTGKTSILRHIQDKSRDKNAEFIIFKKSFLEEIDLSDFSKLPLMLDEENIKKFKHYHHTVKRLLTIIALNKVLNSDEPDDSTRDEVDPDTQSLLEKISKSSVGDAIKFGFDSVRSIFQSAGFDIEKATSGKLLLDGGKLLKRNNDDLLSVFIRRMKRQSKPVRIFLDEIHFAYRSEESLQQDAILVRDTILAVQSLNDRFAEERIDAIIYAAIRSKYLEHPLISTADISHSIESVGHEITYSNFIPTQNHPLFDLVMLRFNQQIEGKFIKKDLFRFYLSGMDADYFLSRTWSKPRDVVRFFKCARKLYPNQITLSESQMGAVWRNYSQEAWKELKSAASPFLPPDSISLFEEILSRITPEIFDGTAKYDMKAFEKELLPVYKVAKSNHVNFYDKDHFIRLLYILGIFATRRRDANDQDIFHSYHRGNRNYHIGGEVLIHPAVLKAFG